jgi:hypothetical protein
MQVVHWQSERAYREGVSLAPGLPRTPRATRHCLGTVYRDIAEAVALIEKTVANHVTLILNKIGADNRSAAAAFAVRHNRARLGTLSQSRLAAPSGQPVAEPGNFSSCRPTSGVANSGPN